jgi:ubiquinone biosynthesis monooxygenase Coq7
MRADEERHGAAAKSAGAVDLPGPIRRLMRMSARVMTRISYHW